MVSVVQQIEASLEGWLVSAMSRNVGFGQIKGLLNVLPPPPVLLTLPAVLDVSLRVASMPMTHTAKNATPPTVQPMLI